MESLTFYLLLLPSHISLFTPLVTVISVQYQGLPPWFTYLFLLFLLYNNNTFPLYYIKIYYLCQILLNIYNYILYYYILYYIYYYILYNYMFFLLNTILYIKILHTFCYCIYYYYIYYIYYYIYYIIYIIIN